MGSVSYIRAQAQAQAAAAAMPSAADAMPEAVDVESRRVIRIGMILLAVGFGGFLAWASLAPLQEGVPSSATVMLSTKRKPVQHAAGGVVSRVLVQEAKLVKEGEVLLELDSVQSRANHESLRRQWLTFSAEQARLEAEQAGRDSVSFSESLREEADATEIMATQRALFSNRRLALRAELAALEENAAAQAEQARGTAAQLSGRQHQLALVNEQMQGTRRLAGEGFVSRNRLRDEERTATELTADAGNLQATMNRLRKGAIEARLRAQQRRQEWLRDVDAKLVEVRRDLAVTEQRLASARVDLDRTVVRAPATGSVMGLAVQSVGAVVRPGDKLMDIVPAGEDLVLEAQLKPEMVDRVSTGMPADIRFSMFNDLATSAIPGKVLSVSGDQMATGMGVQPYFLVRVGLTPEGRILLGKHELQAGMPADVLFKAGERTLLQYLMRPIKRRWATALTER